MVSFSADAILVGEVFEKQSQDMSCNPVLMKACVGEAAASTLSNASRAAEKCCNTNQFKFIYSFYKFKLMSSFKIITVVFVRICRYSIQ